MSLTLLPLPKPERKRCDTRALLQARSETHRKLKHEMEEKKWDARLPRHFNERQQFRQTGEKA